MAFAYGNGSYGCLFDHVEGPFQSELAAADAAAQLFDLNSEDMLTLRYKGILSQQDVTTKDVDGSQLLLGADYIEIFEVDADWSCEP